MSGTGTTPSFFVEGTWVLVDFFDTDRQEPYVIGGLPGISSSLSNSSIGFNDPNGTYPTLANVSDVHENARGSLTSTNATNRDSIRKTAVASADFDGFEIPTVGDNLAVSGSNGSSFDEPLVVSGTYKPVYPKNHVFSSETGHLFEFDDSSDHNRILLSHSSGSYFEYSNDGTLVSHVVKDLFSITSGNRNSLIEGDEVLTVDGGLKLKVNKSDGASNNYDIEIGSNSNFNIMVRSGSVNFNVNGNVNIFSNDDINMSCDNFRLDASNKVSITSGDKMLLDSSGENDINGNPINLN
tara:strand:- start:103 stop:990 length:888 start_codon:yes stop_codon:yes gene_type:complete